MKNGMSIFSWKIVMKSYNFALFLINFMPLITCGQTNVLLTIALFKTTLLLEEYRKVIVYITLLLAVFSLCFPLSRQDKSKGKARHIFPLHHITPSRDELYSFV